MAAIQDIVHDSHKLQLDIVRSVWMVEIPVLSTLTAGLSTRLLRAGHIYRGRIPRQAYLDEKVACSMSLDVDAANSPKI